LRRAAQSQFVRQPAREGLVLRGHTDAGRRRVARNQKAQHRSVRADHSGANAFGLGQARNPNPGQHGLRDQQRTQCELERERHDP